jgi:2,4-dienoyl-CoA reductase-like NADH-dependent reductase (Old Yellow Enzyme family)/thioredoxin reductase
MYNKYPELTSPLVIGSHVLKNRMYASPSMPDLGQGSEPYPTTAMIEQYAKKARNGAAIVTVTGFLPNHNIADETARFPHFDIHDLGTQNYLSQLTESIHMFGSLASAMPGCGLMPGYDVVGGIESFSVEGDNSQSAIGKEITPELMDKMADNYAEEAYIFKDCGFDMVFLHTAYRFHLPSRFLSPLTNKRTDEFNGTIADRAKFLFMICDRIKQRCGKDFLIEASISAFEPEGGNTLEEIVEFARLAEGHIDIIQVRAGEIDPSHVIGFEPQHTPYLYCAEAIKKGGTKVKIAAINGFHYPEDAEAAIAEGKADLIAMARSWICDDEYGKKIYEGRPEDITPCLRCNKCHISSWKDPYTSVCSVNPRWGLDDKISALIPEPGKPKTVAVIGGGPAGMEAAITAAKRGHKVTLFEKSDRLGGLTNHSQNVDFKWTMKEFRDYMAAQTEKAGVTVRLNTEATPELIKQQGFDEIIVAIGGEPVTPPIKGLDTCGAGFAIDAFYNPDALGEKVVIIGGGEIGVEAGIYLARQGHKVTVIEMNDRLATDATPVHYRSMFRKVWEEQEGFSSIVSATCTEAGPGFVKYRDADGAEHRIDADSIVVAAGMRAKTAEALTFFGAGGRTGIVGDCKRVANIQKAMRAAYLAASF